MNLYLREIAKNCMDLVSTLPMVKFCELYGSIASI